MKDFIDQIITVETSDPEDSRKRRLLNILLLGTLGTLLLNLSSLLDPEMWSSGLAPLLISAMVIFLLGITSIYFINRRSGTWAAVLFLLLLTLVINLSDTPYELSNGRSIFVYTFPIIISSLLLFSSASFIFAIISSICMTGLAWSISSVPNLLAIIGFFMLALVSWLTTRSLEQALHDLRTINLNLDLLVEQKTQELASTLSRELLLAGRNQAILNSIADGVIVFDEKNTAILANPALSQLTETPLQAWINNGITDFVQNKSLAPASRESLLRLLESPQKGTTGIRIIWSNKTLSASIARVHNEGGGNIGTVAVFRNVTREVELEKMKDTLMGVVSHELRTPLNAILGYAEMFKEGVYGPLTEKQLSISVRVMTNTERLLTIVNDLLDQAQIQSGKLKIQMVPCKPAEMLDTLHSVMDKIAADKGIEFISELDPAMPPVILGDPQRLQQIMVNLANNAVKFTDTGSVCVKITHADETNWHIQTIDTGDGIPKEAQEFIFESFRQVESSSTRKHGGVGLGLSIVKQLVDLMKGKISIDSEIGKGSAFTVILPLLVERRGSQS